MAELVGRLLSALHGWLRVEVCPGDWPWTVTVAGAVFGLLPVLGALVVAVVRKWTGNRYGVAQLVPFGVIGLITVGWLPLWALTAADEVFVRAARQQAVGLTGGDLASLQRGTLCTPLVDGTQGGYLGDASSVWGAVFESSALGRLAALGFLVIVPLLAILFVYYQARAAFRRGPTWPARLFALPVVLPLLGASSLSATVVAHAWGGFMLAAVAGLFVVLAAGAPRWSVINGSEPAPAAAGPAQPYGYPGQPSYPMYGQPQPQPQPVRQPLAPPPVRQYRPTMIAPNALGPPVPPGTPGAGPGGQLAADPGPLPGTLAGLAAAAPAAGSQSGSPVDLTTMLPTSRFQRIRRLGTGGFGQVWLARDTTLGRIVAVKVATAANAETQERIRREARALAAVDHPNCVRIFDIVDDLDGGGLAIVMEYIAGSSLTDRVNGSRYTDPDAGRLWYTLAGALHAAHGEGLLHRDIKPSNIIVDERGEPRLIDFGIARATGDVTLTAAGMVVGTPDFLPPELAAGKPAQPASDGWQLAATVSYALTGAPPRGHSDGAVAAMLAAVRGEACNQLPAASAHFGLLRRALSPDPTERPALPEVQAELARWMPPTNGRH